MAEENKDNNSTFGGSLEFLWDKWLEELENMNRHMEQKEKEWLESFTLWIEKAETNEEMKKRFYEQVISEQKQWFKLMREEFLTITSGTRFFLPLSTVEEMYKTLEKLEEKAIESIINPSIINQPRDGKEKTLEAFKHYLTYHNGMRKSVLKSIREATNEMKQQQVRLVNEWEKQVKNMVFPFTSFINKKAAN